MSFNMHGRRRRAARRLRSRSAPCVADHQACEPLHVAVADDVAGAPPGAPAIVSAFRRRSHNEDRPVTVELARQIVRSSPRLCWPPITRGRSSALRREPAARLQVEPARGRMSSSRSAVAAGQERDDRARPVIPRRTGRSRPALRRREGDVGGPGVRVRCVQWRFRTRFCWSGWRVCGRGYG